MSRSGYSDGVENWSLIRWRGQVASAIRGKRGQAFLRELVTALEEMPEKKLIRNELKTQTGEVCALGAVGVKRGIKLESIDPEDYETVGQAFGIAHQLAQEIVWENDECSYGETPEDRWNRIYKWAKDKIK